MSIIIVLFFGFFKFLDDTRSRNKAIKKSVQMLAKLISIQPNEPDSRSFLNPQSSLNHKFSTQNRKKNTLTESVFGKTYSHSHDLRQYILLWPLAKYPLNYCNLRAAHMHHLSHKSPLSAMCHMVQ